LVLWSLLSVLSPSFSAPHCPDWVQYWQCDSAWGSEPLGTSPTDTVCSAGCAMSDVAMSLTSYGIEIDGHAANPGVLNEWLTNNGGYLDEDLIIWDTIDSLGKLQFNEMVSDMTPDQMGKYVSQCFPVIVNVRDGTHWVLVINATADPEMWEVRDPAFNQQYYNISTMLNFVVYSVVQ